MVRLARPAPFREPACMLAGVPWWRRRLRQVVPRRGGARTRCWYHGGDWHRVNAVALQVLQRARAQPMAPDDMEEFATAHAVEAGATPGRPRRWPRCSASRTRSSPPAEPVTSTASTGPRPCWRQAYAAQSFCATSTRRSPRATRLPSVLPLCLGTRRPGPNPWLSAPAGHSARSGRQGGLWLIRLRPLLRTIRVRSRFGGMSTRFMSPRRPSWRCSLTSQYGT